MRTPLKLLCSLVVFVAVLANLAQAVNIGMSANNPLVRAVGNSSYIEALPSVVLNDGDIVAAGTNEVSFQIPPDGSRGLGYWFGGTATIESLRLVEWAQSLNQRRLFDQIVVHTSAGDFNFNLLNQEDNTITFGSPITTSYVVLRGVTQHPGSDTQVGIAELEANSAAGTVTPMINLAAGANYSLNGLGWNNVSPNAITNGVMDANNGAPLNAAFNTQPTTAGENITIDLGSQQSVGIMGINQHDFGGATGRNLIQNALLAFSNDNFASTLATRNVTLDQYSYDQVSFNPVTAQYVRLSFQSQYAGSDPNIGFIEVQLFIPEPTSLGLAVIGLSIVLLSRRRTR